VAKAKRARGRPKINTGLCRVRGCAEPVVKARRCEPHYLADLRRRKKAAGELCSSADCDRVARAGGMCWGCYVADRRAAKGES
jgi:hypothetical protein